MPYILELGPGVSRRQEASVAIDKCPTASCDMVRDFAKRGIPFQNDIFDEVLAYDVIEHIEDYADLIFTFNEIYRVLRPNGIFRFTTPNGVHNSMSHMTHSRSFERDSFQYLCKQTEPTMIHMRNSDGIVARFNIEWEDCREEWLFGKFTAIKS